MGSVPIVANIGDGQCKVNFESVAYVPDLLTNLLSVARAIDHGHTMTFRRTEAVVVDSENKIVLRASCHGNLYFVDTVKISINKVTCQEESNIYKWHERLGHFNERDLKLMANKGLVYGLYIKTSEKLSKCEIYIQKKQTRSPFPKIAIPEERTKELLEIIHTDV